MLIDQRFPTWARFADYLEVFPVTAQCCADPFQHGQLEIRFPKYDVEF
jgi:hypothetical protein